MTSLTQTTEAPINPTPNAINLDDAPFVAAGCEVEDHQKGGQFKWDASKVALYLSRKQHGGKWIGGNRLREELKGKPVCNANLLDYLLVNPHLILDEWKGKSVFFWGTIYRVDNRLYVRYLCWDDDRWKWFYGWLDAHWHEDGPAAVLIES